MMKCFLLPTLLLLCSTTAIAQAKILSVGIRCSWTSDSGDGRFGIEASYTSANLGPVIAHGTVFGIDVGPGDVRFHLGYEAISLFSLGLEAGPTLVVPHNGEPELAMHAIVFGGVLVYPFLQYTSVERDSEELGLMFKYPVHSSGFIDPLFRVH